MIVALVASALAVATAVVIVVATVGGSSSNGSKADQAFTKLNRDSRNGGEHVDETCLKRALGGLSNAQLDLIIRFGWVGVFNKIGGADSERLSSCVTT